MAAPPAPTKDQMHLFLGVQIDLTFDPGVGLGRYVVARSGGDRQVALPAGRFIADRGSDVLVVSTAGAPLLPDRRGLARRPRRAARALATEDVWLHRFTFVRGDHALANRRDAEAALEAVAADHAASGLLVKHAFAVVDRAQRAARIADGDPHAIDLHDGIARAVRLGIATAEDIAAGRLAAAVAVAPPPVLRWHEALPSAQAVADALAARAAGYESDELLLRIARDVDQHAHARAALQLPAVVALAAVEFGEQSPHSGSWEALRTTARDLAERALGGRPGIDDQQRAADLIRELWVLAQTARDETRHGGRARHQKVSA
jgi:hypothetical protein